MAKSNSIKVGDFIETAVYEKGKCVAFIGEVVDVKKGFTLDDGNILTIKFEGGKMLPLFESVVRVLHTIQA